MAETADVFITADIGFAEFAGAVARALGYPAPAVAAGDTDAVLPAGDGRPELGLLDSSRGPAEYSIVVWGGDQHEAEASAVRVFDALVAATPWAVETDPEDGTPARSRPALSATA